MQVPVRLAMVAIAWIALAALPGETLAADKPAEARAATLPHPLTPEAIRDLMARLSDEEVRKLLIEQLNRGSARPAGNEAAGMGMMGTMADQAGTWRSRAAEIGAAVVALPAATATAFASLSALPGTGPSLPGVVVLAAMLAAGILAEFIWRRATREWRAQHSAVRGEAFFADAIRRVIGFVVDLAGLLVFTASALAAYFALWHGHGIHGSLVLGALSALLLTRVVVLVAWFILAPSRPAARLLPLTDPPARAFAWFAAIVTAIYAFGTVLVHAYDKGGADAATQDALKLLITMAVFIATLLLIARVRRPISALIRDSGSGGGLIRLVAELWPVAAVAYVAGVCLARVWEIVTGEQGTTGAGMLSLLIVVALPVVDYALCRGLAAAAAAPARAEPWSPTQLVNAYHPVLRRMIHIIVIVVGLLWLSDLWDLNLFSMAQRSLGGRVAGSLLGVSLVVLLAYMLWEIARTAIDRKLAAEQDQPADSPSSRLRTLLPLLRVMLMITIGVMAALSVLAALGVDILPLLAGASVVGIAIGFGSQQLVRDVVSGAFFLMDDAFRLGEYIEVGAAKGRIEKITVRALFLRHHRGALNVLPYGEIKQLRNTSRDWIIMVMEFRLAFGTDLKKVKKILKTVGEEIAADPELGPELLQPLKSQGVMSTDDSAMVVRAKYMARPGNAPYMIRRVAYEKILKAFAAQGIEFASRRVAVYVPPGASDDERVRAAASAIADDAETAPPKPAG